MTLLHRQLLRELLANAALIMATLLGMFYVLSLSFTLGSSRAHGVPMLAVFTCVAYEALAVLPLLLPLTLMSAAIFTYGRLAADGELVAWRAIGLPERAILTPALLVGALGMLLLAVLQDRAIPMAEFRGRSELQAGILRNLESILSHADRHVIEKSWKAEWRDARRDGEGRLVLYGLDVWEYEGAGRVRAWTRAEQARCLVDQRSNQIVLEMSDVRRQARDREPLVSGTFRLGLDLEALSSRQSVSSRRAHLSYERLLSEGRRIEESAERLADRSARRSALESARKHFIEYHSRVALAAAPLLFALLGALLGIGFPRANRVLLFLTGFLVVVGVFYPLVELGEQMGRKPGRPLVVAQWIANTVLLLLCFVTRLFRRDG